MSAVLRRPTLRMRPMREDDLGDIHDIECSSYQFPWSPSIFRDCLRVGYCCWILQRNGQTEAYGVMSVAGGESHILNLCVRANSQGEGLGRALLEHLLEVARKHHCDTVLLEVRPSNGAALRLYEGMGFARVGLRRAYYPGRGGREDALILARQFS